MAHIILCLPVYPCGPLSQERLAPGSCRKSRYRVPPRKTQEWKRKWRVREEVLGLVFFLFRVLGFRVLRILWVVQGFGFKAFRVSCASKLHGMDEQMESKFGSKAARDPKL